MSALISRYEPFALTCLFVASACASLSLDRMWSVIGSSRITIRRLCQQSFSKNNEIIVFTIVYSDGGWAAKG